MGGNEVNLCFSQVSVAFIWRNHFWWPDDVYSVMENWKSLGAFLERIKNWEKTTCRKNIFFLTRLRLLEAQNDLHLKEWILFNDETFTGFPCKVWLQMRPSFAVPPCINPVNIFVTNLPRQVKKSTQNSISFFPFTPLSFNRMLNDTPSHIRDKEIPFEQ